LLKLNHPHASLQNILTFMWCTWKSRGDCLFGRKKGEPHQININAQALLNNMKLFPSDQAPMNKLSKTNSRNIQDYVQGQSIPTDLLITGPRIFSDAAWKKNKPRTGIGVFIQADDDQGRQISAMIQILAPKAASALQAETMALSLAILLSGIINIYRPTMLTDNSNLAKAVASRKIDCHLIHWNCRQDIAQILSMTAISQASIFHINRNLNGVAHCCARQALINPTKDASLTCSSAAHRASPCPIISALRNFIKPGFVILDIHCC
jgi:hypothetical protein